MSKDVEVLERQSFTFYLSFEKGIQHLSDNDQFLVYRAISRYSLMGVEPQLTGGAAMAWEFIRPILEKARKGFENGVKGGEYGNLGGNPNFKAGQPNPYYRKDNPQDNPQDNPTYTDTITDTYTGIKKNTKKIDKLSIEKEFISGVEDGFREIVQEWFTYKRERGEQYKSIRAMQHFLSQLKTLSNNQPATASAIVEQSMANNWAGIFKSQKSKNYDAGTHNKDSLSFTGKNYGKSTI